jgi:hypothetical protein
MTQLAADTRPPNEKPTVYRGAAALIGGALVVLFCVAGSIDLMAESGTGDLTGASILVLVAVLAWLYGVYPAAFSWTDRLVVRNPFRTIDLPWSAVTDVSARLSFVAHTESKRFTVWAIPVSLRERRRSERHKVRELTQAQRAAKRGLSPDMFGPSRSHRPTDPIAGLSFADQAIAEMSAKRESYAVKVKLAAAKAEAAAAAAADAPAAQDAPVVRAAAAEPTTAAVAAVDAASVRWAWLSIALLVAAVAFLIVSLTLHH